MTTVTPTKEQSFLTQLNDLIRQVKQLQMRLDESYETQNRLEDELVESKRETEFWKNQAEKRESN